MELKKGMYVRHEECGIGKVISICECEQCKERGFYEPIIEFSNDTDYITSYNYMQTYEGKASSNIIDLIKVGDYVNGYLVVEEKYHYENKDFIDFERDVDAGSGYGYQLLAKDIKSIVTKEMMESIKYYVK